MRSLVAASFVVLTVTLGVGCSSSDSGTSSTGAGGSGSGGSGGAGGGAGVDTALTWDPTKPGNFGCGHRTLDMTYAPPGGLPSRTIPVHFWYPTNATEGDHPKYHSIADTVAFEGVPLAPTTWKSGLPVLVHSHGYKGFAGNSARLMCHFASHGWLAVAPEHIGNVINDTPDKLPLSVYVHRPFDIRASLDFLGTLPTGDELVGKTDMGRVAMSGHSFGTYTAWAIGGATLNADWFHSSCTKGDVTDCTDAQLAVLAGDVSDKRAQVVLPLAGAPRSEIGDASFDTAKVPVLQMSGSLNDVGDGPVFAEVSKVDLTWVDVDGGCHQLFGLGNNSFVEPGVPCSQLPDEEGFSLVNPFALSYVRYHVLADRSDPVKGIVEGTTSLSPKVHVMHKTP